MRLLCWLVTGTVLATLAACVSPEEQRARDANACAGYGFQPNTTAFANCMMQTAQQRAAQQAAAARQQSLNNTIAEQAERDRQAQADRDAAAQNAAHQSEIEKMMSSPSIPEPSIPQPSIPDLSGMHCTGSTGPNAGTLSCSN